MPLDFGGSCARWPNTRRRFCRLAWHRGRAVATATVRAQDRPSTVRGRHRPRGASLLGCRRRFDGPRRQPAAAPDRRRHAHVRSRARAARISTTRASACTAAMSRGRPNAASRCRFSARSIATSTSSVEPHADDERCGRDREARERRRSRAVEDAATADPARGRRLSTRLPRDGLHAGRRHRILHRRERRIDRADAATRPSVRPPRSGVGTGVLGDHEEDERHGVKPERSSPTTRCGRRCSGRSTCTRISSARWTS